MNALSVFLTTRRNWLLATLMALFLGYGLMDLPYHWAALAPAAILMIACLGLIRKAQSEIDVKLKDFLGPGEPSVFRKEYPYFAYPDFQLAVGHYLSGYRFELIRTSHAEELVGLLSQERTYHNRGICNSANLAWKTDFEKEEYFAKESFWLATKGVGAGEVRIVIRLKLEDISNKAVLETASRSEEAARGAVEEIRRIATEKSIYHGKTLDVSFAEAIKDAYGDVESRERIELIFRKVDPIEDRDIILDEDIRGLIQELIFDFDRIKEELPRHNIGKKRGVIFYGPPGTGKTFTTKFISSRLIGRTKLICYGKILSSIKVVANVAKMFSPSLVILEDVDLVFNNREINFDNNNLSEFMDALDGFTRNEDVIFILNTNSIERIEEAIKNRPGRISQCIFMGAPNDTLRERYIDSLLDFHLAELDGKERLVQKTRGCTQAFLKELIQRMIQKRILTSGPVASGRIPLEEKEGLEVLLQMQSSGGDKGNRIIGFTL